MLRVFTQTRNQQNAKLQTKQLFPDHKRRSQKTLHHTKNFLPQNQSRTSPDTILDPLFCLTCLHFKGSQRKKMSQQHKKRIRLKHERVNLTPFIHFFGFLFSDLKRFRVAFFLLYVKKFDCKASACIYFLFIVLNPLKRFRVAFS